MKLTKLFVAVPALLALVAAFGCGGEKLPAGMPKPQSTTITLTLDGKGLADASLTMIPSDGGQYTAVGTTDASGVAEMKTNGKFKGAVPGSYKVVVGAKDEIDYGEFGPPPTGDPAAMEKWNRDVDAAGGAAAFKRISLVSQEFTAVDVTPLTITVGEGKVAETFDLGGSVREEVEVEEK
jgi:hypothetical protein